MLLVIKQNKLWRYQVTASYKTSR